MELAELGYKCFGNGSLRSPAAGIAPKESRPLFSKLRTLRMLLSSCITYKVVAVNAFRCALQARPLNRVSFKRAADLLIRLNLITTVMSDDYDLVIFDQGVIQYIWSIAATNKPASNADLLKLLESVLNEIPLAVILVDINTGIAVERIIQRPTMSSRFDKMPSNRAAQSLSTQRDFFMQFVNWSVELKNIPHLALNGTHPINENAGTVVRFIVKTWQITNP
ncbi:MAG: hypothetical protein R3293_02275 [Candidatus Promineifilaceae bacterium]|nr:hypothetical protein [Candidatus Promineifilaceae bacterium]